MVKYKYLIYTSSKLINDGTRIYFNVKHNLEPKIAAAFVIRLKGNSMITSSDAPILELS